MTIHHRDLTKWVTSHGATNRPDAIFWLGQALAGLRVVSCQLRRADQDRPGSAVGTQASVEEIIHTLERRYPSEAVGEG